MDLQCTSFHSLEREGSVRLNYAKEKPMMMNINYVSRSSGLAKIILQGTVKGKRKRGRQKKRWDDIIKE